MTLSYRIAIIATILVAFALRMAAIDQIPVGLSHDEANNGIAALQVLDGQRAIFFEINKGIEPLIIYLEALAFYAFGIGPVQLRLVNVFAGMLTVALVYPLAARLFNREIALLAMAGVAVSFWAVFVSRLTLRAVLLPPVLLLTLYWLWLTLSVRRSSRATLVYFALSGAAAGLSMYTYLSSRIVPLLVLALFGFFAITGRTKKRHWLGLLLHLVIWAAIFAPLATYFIENDTSFSRRADQVTTIPYLLNGEFGPTLRNTIATLGMFTFSGDTTDRYNLDGRPVFNWLTGLFFYAGLGMLLWRVIRRRRLAGAEMLLLSSLGLMLVPDFITDDSPHFLRTIGAMPFVYIIWAVGAHAVATTALTALGSRAERFSARVPLLRNTCYGLLVMLILLQTGTDYFVSWANAPNARYIYGADIAQIATYLKQSPSEDLPAISAEFYRDLDPFRLALHFGGTPPFVLWFDGTQSIALPPSGSGLSPRYLFSAYAPPAQPFEPLLTPEPVSGTAFQLYRLASGTGPLAQIQANLTPVSVTINEEVRLLGYQTLSPLESGGQLRLLLGWQALKPLPPGTDYTFVVELFDGEGNLWLRTDGNGTEPVNWQPGVTGLQLLTLRLPGFLPPRRFELVAQLFDRGGGQPLPTESEATAVPLGPIQAVLDDDPPDVPAEALPNARSTDEGRTPEVGLTLRGHSLSSETVRAGESLAVTLYWQTQNRPTRDYSLHFFLATTEGGLVYRWPGVAPAGGEWSTSHWPAGYWVKDVRRLPITEEVPKGRYELRAVWLPTAAEPSPDLTKQHHHPEIMLESVTIGTSF